MSGVNVVTGLGGGKKEGQEINPAELHGCAVLGVSLQPPARSATQLKKQTQGALTLHQLTIFWARSIKLFTTERRIDLTVDMILCLFGGFFASCEQRMTTLVDNRVVEVSGTGVEGGESNSSR